MTTEKFDLKWNDFKENVSQSFANLRNESSLFDVTLVSEDHKQMSAHKVVLSACSDFFKDIFNRNVHSHPLVYLDSIESSELDLIVDYIYHGEVQVNQDKVERFLELGQRLKLGGLIDREESSKSQLEENEKKPTMMEDKNHDQGIIEKVKDEPKPQLRNCRTRPKGL